MLEESKLSRLELPTKVTYEVKSEEEVTDQDLKDLQEFSNSQLDAAIEATRMRSEGWEDKWEAAYVHGRALDPLKITKDNPQVLNIILARNEQGELLGYSLVVIDPNKVDSSEKVTETFIGVRPDMQRLGIGTVLLRTRIDKLKEMGSTVYKTRARPQAIKLYDSLKIPYTEKPQPNHPEAKILTVYLNRK